MLGCKECAFNFGGVCAGQRYSQEVNDSFKFECDDFKMSLEVFSFYNQGRSFPAFDKTDQFYDEKHLRKSST